jgi:NAD(P)-dependent dehydrogenase (short-subunit alcohol dehydrogenase family)
MAHNKVVLITGAGSGIGRSVALAFLKDGYRTVLTGRRTDALEETLKLSGASPEQALIHSADVGDEASVKRLFDACVARFGRLDVVFNNAGIGAPPLNLEELPVSKWQEVVNTNLTGVFLCTQAAFRVMKAQSPQGGRIINNGSISAYAPRPNSIAYTATKHAVSGITKSSSLDGRKYNIAVGQIDIGNALTEMAQRMTQGVQQANGEIAIEAVMDVSNVGTSVLHMASLPLEANILNMTVMASKMPFVGRG